MECEFCKSSETFVTDSRWKEEINCRRRRYECRECGKRFFTQEKYEDDYPYQHEAKRLKLKKAKELRNENTR